MKKLASVFVFAMLIAAPSIAADNYRYNTMEDRYEIASPDAKLKYNVREQGYEYVEPDPDEYIYKAPEPDPEQQKIYRQHQPGTPEYREYHNLPDNDWLVDEPYLLIDD